MFPILVMNAILLVIAILLVVAERILVTYGECKITLNKEKVLTVQGGESLLNYFTRAKIFIPSACGGKATCGYCKVEVLAGGGQILPTEEVFIPKPDRLKGIRLACQVKVKNDIEVMVSPDLLEAQEFQAIVASIVDVTRDIKHIVMRLLEPSTIKFKPGQYVQFRIPETDEFRAYSIASTPLDETHVELVVRLIPSGLCSTYIHEALDVNDKIVLTGPFGDFYLREDSTKDIICIGGGCGMAPIRSIVNYMVEKGMPRKLTYFFGARTKKDLFFTEELKAIERKFPNFRYIAALSEPSHEDNWDGEVGFVTQVAEKYIDEKRSSEAYLCGPPPMIDAANRVLLKKGIDLKDIYFDKF